MTKEETNPAPNPTPIQPLNPKRQYTTFYLVMLILSTLGTSIATISLIGGVPEVMRTYGFAPGFSIFLALDALITLTSIAALVLLWLKKNPLAIWLKLGTYGALVIAYIGQLIFSGPVKQDYVEQAIRDGLTNRESAELFSNISFYGGYVFGLITVITMALLWWFAYKSQQKADEE